MAYALPPSHNLTVLPKVDVCKGRVLGGLVSKVHLQNLFSQADEASRNRAALRVPPTAHLWDGPGVDEPSLGVDAPKVDFGNKLDPRGLERVPVGRKDLNGPHTFPLGTDDHGMPLVQEQVWVLWRFNPISNKVRVVRVLYSFALFPVFVLLEQFEISRNDDLCHCRCV